MSAARTPIPVADVEPEELAAMLDDEDVGLVVDLEAHDPRSTEEAR
ncbi:MAG: hypothetical protein ACJ752_14100 [Gaiellaceae bacterium]